MDIQQCLEETNAIKTEILDADYELSLPNIKKESAENVTIVNDTKTEKIVMPIKSEDMDYTFNEFVKCESYNFLKIPENCLTPSKCEIKNEEMDISHTSVYFEKDDNLKHSTLLDPATVTGGPSGSDCLTTLKYDIKSEEMDILDPLNSEKDANLKHPILLDAATVTGGPSGSLCDSNPKDNIQVMLLINVNTSELKKQFQQVNQLSTAALNLESNVTRQRNLIPYKCYYCDYRTESKTSLVNHTLLHGKKNKRLFYCANCDYSTKYKRSLNRHRITKHLKKLEKHSCAGCKKQFNEKVSLDNHIIKNHQHLIGSVSSTIYNCSTCDYKSTRKNNLNRHMSKVHLGNYAHSCVHCGKHFKAKQALGDHIIREHKNFIDSVSIKVHNCPTCDFKTTQMSHLKNHMVKMHFENYVKHFCPCCEKHFKKKTSLDNHIMKNHQKLIDSVSSEILNCPSCDYKTTHKSSLRNHVIKIHSGNCKEHLCTYCEKRFKNKSSLDDHIVKKHQNIIKSVSSKVHNCPTCDFKTVRKSHLRQHINIHSENDKHSCTFCDKHFKIKMSLDDHIIKKHQDSVNLVNSTVYSCSTCNYKTTIKRYLRQHRIKIHSGQL